MNRFFSKINKAVFSKKEAPSKTQKLKNANPLPGVVFPGYDKFSSGFFKYQKSDIIPYNSDYWKFYELFNNSKLQDFDTLVFPSGNILEDAFVISEFEKSGAKVCFFPVWSFIDRENSVEDLLWRINKNSLIARELFDMLLFYLSEECNKVKSIYIPNKIGNFGKFLKRNFEKMGYSIFHLTDEKLKIKIDPILRVQMSKALGIYDHKLEMVNGYSGGNIKIFVGPLDSVSQNEKELLSNFSNWLLPKLETLKPSDHIYFILSSRKNGFMNHAVFRRLRDIPNKSFLLSNQIISSELFALPSKIHYFRDSEKHYLKPFFASFKIPFIEPTSSFKHAYRSKNIQLAEVEQSTLMSTSFNSKIKFSETLNEGLYSPLIAVPDPLRNKEITHGRQKYLCKLLGAKNRINLVESPNAGISPDFYIQWGAEPNFVKQKNDSFRNYFGQNKLFVEDGFIRSIGLWTDPNEPSYSITFDTNAAYYDSTKPSLLEDFLNSDWVISKEQIKGVNKLLEKILKHKITKYNYMPITNKYGVCGSKEKKILIVDQKADDMSLVYGGVSDKTFINMLQNAIESDASEILIKQHPCAIDGGEEYANYTKENVLKKFNDSRIRFISEDINPYSLIDAVSDVFVASSGMGLEAIFAGKNVSCFGTPFYSGWGLTKDYIEVSRRHRIRTKEELFYVFYIIFSRYINPKTEELGKLEELVDYLIEHLNHYDPNKAQ